MKLFAKYSLMERLIIIFDLLNQKVLGKIKLLGFEGFVWISALTYLAFFFDPVESHFTICPLSNFGFEDCPGCGLGRSISLLFSGKFIESFQTHILGIPAVVILLLRIFTIFKTNYLMYKNFNTKERTQNA